MRRTAATRVGDMGASRWCRGARHLFCFMLGTTPNLSHHIYCFPSPQFIVYPTDSITMEIQEILASTKDKQNVKIDVAVMYQLKPTSLIALYNERQQSYDSFYRREITSQIKEECVLWETIPDFYARRQEIAAQIEVRVRSMFDANHASLVEFQMLGITLQRATEDKIIETLEAEQDEITESYFQQSSVVRSQKEEYTVDAEGQIRVVQSKANAIGINIVASATATAFEKVTTALSARLSTIENGLGLGSAKKILLYSFYNAFGESGPKTRATIGGETNMFKL